MNAIDNGHREVSGARSWVGAVHPWPEPVDGGALLDNLAQTLRRFVVLPAWAPETLALWVLHTYAFELRDVTAYLGLESPQKRCGKTTLLGVLERVGQPPHSGGQHQLVGLLPSDRGGAPDVVD